MDFLLGGEIGSSGRLLWAASWTEVLLAAVLATVALGVAAWTGRAARSRGRRWLELGAWLIGLVLVVASLANPVWLEESGREEPGRFVVLIDGTRSMDVRELSGTRGSQVSDIISSLPAGADVYTFGEDVQVGAPEEWELGGSDLGAALSTIADRSRLRPRSARR